MLTLRLRRDAVSELTKAWTWYESQRIGLGDEFHTCVGAAL